MQLVQDTGQSNVDNLKIVRRKLADISRKKKANLKAKIEELLTIRSKI